MLCVVVSMFVIFVFSLVLCVLFVIISVLMWSPVRALEPTPEEMMAVVSNNQPSPVLMDVVEDDESSFSSSSSTGLSISSILNQFNVSSDDSSSLAFSDYWSQRDRESKVFSMSVSSTGLDGSNLEFSKTGGFYVDSQGNATREYYAAYPDQVKKCYTDQPVDLNSLLWWLNEVPYSSGAEYLIDTGQMTDEEMFEDPMRLSPEFDPDTVLEYMGSRDEWDFVFDHLTGMQQ